MEKNWKDTLLMPQTDFSMKANLSEKEKAYRKAWIKDDIYEKSLLKNKDGSKGNFVLHDGPPYANGNLHVGHALNKILKDIIIRRKNMEGFYAPALFGWDTHGLPIENKMLEKIGKNSEELDPLSLRVQAAQFALQQVENQKSQFEQMQLFFNPSEKYITLDKNYEAEQLKLFKKMVMGKLVYKGLKPVYWSPSSQSALAEAEVEYKDHMSPQVIVAFKVTKGNEFVTSGDNLLIMTTTPWTLIANAAVAVGTKFNYSLVQANGQNYIIASNLIEDVAKRSKWEEFKVLKSFSGDKLIDLEYKRPIKRELSAKVVPGFHVQEDSGTGLVHIAPLFGEDDFIIGKEFKLDMIMHVDAKGNLNQEAGEYKDLFYQDANKNIGMFLDENKELVSLKFLKHSYPHDWRTGKPVIYRGVPQWFVNIKSIKPLLGKILKDVVSYPKWGIERIKEMISNRDEWTISRQRIWGVPIIIFYDENDQPIFIEEIFDHVIALVEENGTNIWWEKSTDELLPEKYRNKNWTREMDIMDVWFDSGSSSIAVKPKGIEGPFDLYLEGSDQYRGWFNSSLINSIIYRQKSPFKTLLSHGFVLDKKHQKMSKSKGNVVDPLKIIEQKGADILRLWVANCEFSSDVTISDDIIKQNIEIYRRIRNTFRFMLGNIHDFDFDKDAVKLKGVHKYINVLVNNFAKRVNDYYDEFKFIEIIKETNKIFINLSGWYFDFAKDILYCDAKNDHQRRSIQTNIYIITDLVSKVLAPILPTTMEEIYKYFNAQGKGLLSIFLERVSTSNKELVVEKEIDDFYHKDRLHVNKILEDARKNNVIKRSNEAILHVDIPKEKRIANEKDYAKYFMVAKVIFAKEWKIESFTSAKCHRCWNHFQEKELNQDSICQRCKDVTVKNNL